MQLITNKFLKERFALGKRDDDRDPMTYRDIKLTLNEIPNAEGSAIVEIGNTKVLTGVKVDLSEPMSDTPNDGNMTTSAELLPMADDNYDVGPPTPFGVELARVVDRAIRAAGVIDTEKLFIEEGKVWGVFVDMYILNNDGNLFDAGLLASVAALLSCKVPKYENETVIREAMGKLPTKNITTSCTFAKFADNLLLDPTANEEALAESRVTIGNDEEVIRSMQKGMSGSFSMKDLDQLIDVTFEKSKTLRQILKNNTGD